MNVCGNCSQEFDDRNGSFCSFNCEGAAVDVYGERDDRVPTDDRIREYVHDHWRSPWMDGSPGKGSVNDAATILFSATTSFECQQRIRAEFARLIGGVA